MTKELWAGFAEDEDVITFRDLVFTVRDLRRDPSLAATALAWWHGRQGAQAEGIERQLHEEREMRSKGGLARADAVQQKAEDDWGDVVRAMLQRDPRTQVKAIFKALVETDRATGDDEDKIYRFVRRVRGKKPVRSKKSARSRRPAT
jgi:hypothetical protein